jgi:hypothetical protein
MSWQLIETAPRDGTKVLAGWDSGAVYIARWDGFHGVWVDGRSSFSEPPTHWMTLPKPPRRFIPWPGPTPQAVHDAVHRPTPDSAK